MWTITTFGQLEPYFKIIQSKTKVHYTTNTLSFFNPIVSIQQIRSAHGNLCGSGQIAGRVPIRWQAHRYARKLKFVIGLLTPQNPFRQNRVCCAGALLNELEDSDDGLVQQTTKTMYGCSGFKFQPLILFGPVFNW